MKAEQTTDTDFIVKCVTHPLVWDHLTDDASPDVEFYFPPMNVLWVRVEDYGVFMLTKLNCATHEVHTILLPSAKGKAVEIGKTALQWAWDNTDAKRIITRVPEFNPLALRLALKVGFVKYGVNTKSFQKRGVLYDVIELGINKGESSCQQ